MPSNEIVLKPKGNTIEIYVNGKFIGTANMTIQGDYRGVIKLKKVM